MNGEIAKGDIKEFLEQSMAAERDLVVELQAKARRGWLVAAAEFVILLGLCGSVIVLSNRPTPEPVMLRVDNTTGVVERITTLAEDQVTSNEADDKMWINRFVLNRESYNYNTIQQTHDMTMLLSGADVGREYDSYYSGPNARDLVWQNNVEVRVDVRSISPDIQNRTAVVRFTTQKIFTGRGVTPEPPKHWIANLRYTYVANAEMTDSDRLNNPKAFQVLSYRADPEVFSGQ